MIRGSSEALQVPNLIVPLQVGYYVMCGEMVECGFFKKMGQPLLRLFSVFSSKQYNFYNKTMWKNVHPVYGARIRTHNLLNMSRHP